jgi:hypothetical protein
VIDIHSSLFENHETHQRQENEDLRSIAAFFRVNRFFTTDGTDMVFFGVVIGFKTP